jgi:hypothetical protein
VSRPLVRAFAAAAGLLLGAAGATEPSPDSPPAEPGEQPAPEEGGTWVDRSHRLLEKGLSGVTGRLDSFFEEERVPELEQATSFVHVRNELRIAEDRLLAYRVRVLASVKLPALDRWLSNARLVASGENQPAPSPELSQDPTNPAYSPSLKAEQANLELRVDLLDEPATVIDVGGGVRLRLPVEPFVRSRFRRRLSPGLGVSGRFTQSVFWTNREGFGESTELALGRQLATHTLLRAGGAAILTDVSPGLTWTGEMGVLHELTGVRTAAYLAGATNGHTRPVAMVDLYRAFLRLRRAVWRDWLFLELEPEIGWPATAERPRHRVLALTVRLEVQVEGRAEEPPAP